MTKVSPDETPASFHRMGHLDGQPLQSRNLRMAPRFFNP
jgi:hypothetical protein